MQKDKAKTATVNKLAVHVGGLVVGLPLAIGLGGMLMLTVFSLLIILGAGLVSGLTTILTVIIGVCVAMLFILVQATLKFSGGIRALFQRLRGIQQEQARIERLMQKDDSQISDSAENVLYSEENSVHQQKKR
jgi:hypothetical protein